MQRKHERKTNSSRRRRRRRRRSSNAGRERERENEPNGLPRKTRREVHQLQTRLLRIFSSFNGVREDQRPTQNSNSYLEHLQGCSVCDLTKLYISHIQVELFPSFLSFFQPHQQNQNRLGLPIGERLLPPQYKGPEVYLWSLFFLQKVSSHY